MLVTDSTPRNSAVWTPDIQAGDAYDVYARWTAAAGQATDAPYTIHHSGGATVVTVDQTTSGGQWVLLGTFTMEPGQNHRVELTDEADGTVVADAIKLSPQTTTPRLATWTPTIGASDSYDVYAKWTAETDRAPDAKYTVHHAGGSTVVTVNQRRNSGEWRLLGSFTMDPASNHRVELSDTVTGVVVADAIYVVPTPAAAPPDAFVWTPTVPAAADYEILARWTAASGRASNAQYVIDNGTGFVPVIVDQRANGGQWVSLGTHALAAGTGNTITLTRNGADGTVVADAIRLLRGVVPAGDLAYIHSDHLGQPRLMTDAGGAVVWDRIPRPFGETQAESGASTTALRFPGQIADDEAGYTYNYFRDYDPTTGRYLQSDPIGLAGGLNTYAYVGGNPVNYVDPYGLVAIPLLNPLDLIPDEQVCYPANDPNDPLQPQFTNWMRLVPWVAKGAKQGLKWLGKQVPKIGKKGGPKAPRKDPTKGLRKQLELHKKRLEDYRRNPEAYDNKGHLKKAPTPEARQRVIDGRIRNLENQIRDYQRQIDNIPGSGR